MINYRLLNTQTGPRKTYKFFGPTYSAYQDSIHLYSTCSTCSRCSLRLAMISVDDGVIPSGKGSGCSLMTPSPVHGMASDSF